MSYDQKLKDLEMLQGDLRTADDFIEVFEDICLDKEFMRDPERCSIVRRLMFEQGKFLGGELGKAKMEMSGPGNN
jgi:hypothetical protein